MAKASAGLLPYRWRGGRLEVFLVHPGGPFWAKKDAAAWSAAKGEVEQDEALLDAARREFAEETGLALAGSFLPLAPARQPSGKLVHVWAIETDIDPAAIRSNAFTLEWPPRSGEIRQFPEVDRAGWFGLVEARGKIHKGQVALLDDLELKLRR
jgi:predicted NUDIX family NTP pyrophosphohydrolase